MKTSLVSVTSRSSGRMLLSITALFAATCVLAPWTGQAVPPNPVRSLVGLWQGTFQSAINPALQGEIVLEPIPRGSCVNNRQWYYEFHYFVPFFR